MQRRLLTYNGDGKLQREYPRLPGGKYEGSEINHLSDATCGVGGDSTARNMWQRVTLDHLKGLGVRNFAGDHQDAPDQTGPEF